MKVDFETIAGGTATDGEDYHARRTYTHVILAGDKTAQMGFALIEDTVYHGTSATPAIDGEGKTSATPAWSTRTASRSGDLDITTDEADGNDHRADDHHDQRGESDHRDPGHDRGRGRRVARFQSQALAEVRDYV